MSNTHASTTNSTPQKPKMMDLLKQESRYLWKSFGKSFLWGTLIGTLLMIALCVVSVLNSPEPTEAMVWVIIPFYSLFYGMFLGLGIAVIGVFWAMFGVWLLLPAVLFPVFTLISCWILSPWLGGLVQDVIAALQTSAKDHTWVVGAVGKAGHAGPIILVIAAPLLLVDLILISASVPVLGSFFMLAFGVLLALSLGMVPAFLLSMVFLLRAWYRRIQNRIQSRSQIS